MRTVRFKQVDVFTGAPFRGNPVAVVLQGEGLSDADMLNEYEQYGRFQDTKPYTAVLEVGQTYPDGTGPVPANLTALDLVVYPQGHGWHQVCEPTDEVGCFLGAGAGIDVTFDLYVTVFYNQPVPEGYTLLAA